MGCLPPQFVSCFVIGWFEVWLHEAPFDSNICGECKYLWTDAADQWEVTIGIDWR
jgi:hypothetical protein